MIVTHKSPSKKFDQYFSLVIIQSFDKNQEVNIKKMNSPAHQKILTFALIGISSSTLIVSLLVTSIHFIDEGHVGIYYKYGALQDGIGSPGLNFKTPYVSKHEQVTIRPTSNVLPVFQAVTKDAIPITFHEVEVISSVPMDNVQWLVRKFGPEFRKVVVFDRLKEEIRRHCFSHEIDQVYNQKFTEMTEVIIRETQKSIERLATGKIDLLNLIIPKPEIPKDIARNYQAVKVQWTQKLVAEKELEKEEVKKQIQQMKAVADANREKEVKIIELEQQILQKEAEKNISIIENERYKLEEENKANVLKFMKEKEAEGNRLVYSDEYGYGNRIKMAEAFSKNNKIYFSGMTPLGGIFDQFMDKIKEEF